MQISSHRIVPGEIDHELIALSVSLGSFALAAAWFALRLPWPICAFHALTGHPCVTCGATRAAIQFFHGHFSAAWKWNPLVFAGLSAMSIFDAYAFVVLIARRPRLRIAQLTSAEKTFIRLIIIALLVINWAYLLAANPSL